MLQIYLLSCYWNIDTMLHIAYGGLWFQSTLEAVNSKEKFNADVFVWNICINGWGCLYLSYCDFHKAFTDLLLPIIFETEILKVEMHDLLYEDPRINFFYPETWLKYL